MENVDAKTIRGSENDNTSWTISLLAGISEKKEDHQ
jgi:hypothetical protein